MANIGCFKEAGSKWTCRLRVQIQLSRIQGGQPPAAGAFGALTSSGTRVPEMGLLQGPPHWDPWCESGAETGCLDWGCSGPRAGSFIHVAAFDSEPYGNGTNIFILFPKASRERSDDNVCTPVAVQALPFTDLAFTDLGCSLQGKYQKA